MTFSTQPHPCLQTIARDLEKDVQFTRHAEEQMTLRGIPRPTVLAVVAQGRMVPNHENELIQLMGFCVVMDDNRVVTTFYRNQYSRRRR